MWAERAPRRRVALRRPRPTAAWGCRVPTPFVRYIFHFAHAYTSQRSSFSKSPSICVDYRRTGDATATATDANISRNRMDYKTILPADEFVVYSQLREFRNEFALAESVPVYALFSNEQLAQVVQRRWSPLKRLSLVCFASHTNDFAKAAGVAKAMVEG